MKLNGLKREKEIGEKTIEKRGRKGWENEVNQNKL
jgi:hypothetical protein